MSPEIERKLDSMLVAGAGEEELKKARTDKPVFLGSEPEHPGPSYKVTDKGFLLVKPSRDGPVSTLISNFTAIITAQVVEVDSDASQVAGMEAGPRRWLKIEARHKAQATVFWIPSEIFGSLDWRMTYLGATAVVFPGVRNKEHVATAIQLHSPDPVVVSVYTRTGWREMSKGKWAYIHGGGAIGGGAIEDVLVWLPPSFEPFVLPPPPCGEERRQAVKASLSLLRLGPSTIMLPLLAAIYRSVLGPSDFAIFLVGRTGVFKSQIASIGQSHFGAGFDASSLPANWSSTENALEASAYAAKDALLTVDDFVPHGSPKEAQAANAKAERVLRAQGNNSGRQRLSSDLKMRPPMPPSGMISATGEDIPRGQSLVARIVSLSIAPGDIDADVLTECQALAAQGVLAQAMAAFLSWLAPQYPRVQKELKDSAAYWRGQMSSEGQHGRAASNAGHLMHGWVLCLEFAVECGAISQEESAQLGDEGLEAIKKAVALHSQDQDTVEPALRFIEVLSAAISSKRAYLASRNGIEPRNPLSWGWKFREAGAEGKFDEWLAPGVKIGWVDGDDVYLNLTASMTVASTYRDGNDLHLNPRTLTRRLNEMGLLASDELDRGTYLVRRILDGGRQNVLHLKASLFGAVEPDQPDQPDQPDHEEQDPEAVPGDQLPATSVTKKWLDANPEDQEMLTDDQHKLLDAPEVPWHPGYGLD